MKLCGHECKVLNVLIVRLGFESQQDGLIFFFLLHSAFLKQSFKKGFNIRNPLSTEELKY